MDTDNPNVNDWQHDYNEWWEGVKKEQMAKMEKMDAEERMEHNSMWEDFSKEADAAGDWLEADWKQFKARVTQWINEGEMEVDEAV